MLFTRISSCSHNVFKSLLSLDRQNPGLVGKDLTLYDTIPTFNDLNKKAVENIVGKGENAGNQHFLLFPRAFSTLAKTHIIIIA